MSGSKSNRLVHYLVRDPLDPNKAVYPFELVGEDPYETFGSYHVMGEKAGDIRGEYLFPAIHGERVVVVRLARQGEENLFVAEVSGIGRFAYDLVSEVEALTYAGAHRYEENDMVVGVLVERDAEKLESAALDHDFYFVGMGPGVASDVDVH